MSQENVEVVRRLFDAASKGDAATVFSLTGCSGVGVVGVALFQPAVDV
jgi:ketosteroid isomerase-like protein